MKEYPIVMGFDDARYEGFDSKTTHLIGVVCQGTRMVGVSIGKIDIDGTNSTDVLVSLVRLKENHVQYVITDTITFGGFNIMDIQRVYQETKKPVIAVVDRSVDLNSVKQALVKKFPDSYREKLKLIISAGNLYQHEITTAGGNSTIFFHAIGIDIDRVRALLNKISIDSKQPECTRMAHLIGGGFVGK
ncbi:MAG: DUF99 family protein [Candidatus Lokiarchaeota archaeon]|nr:DUF99 family protein [Candidatus Lokiarchaeota archaeon]